MEWKVPYFDRRAGQDGVSRSHSTSEGALRNACDLMRQNCRVDYIPGPDLSVLITFYIFRGAPFGFPFEAWGATPCPCYFTTCRIEGRSRAWSKIIKSNGTIQPISWL